MARKLVWSLHHLPNTFEFGLAAMTLAFCGMALFMCASHSRRWHRRRWNACTEFFADDDPVIHHNNIEAGNCDATASMVMDGHSREQQEDSVWHKNILMGGKCQLPDFSGVIIYDCHGNIVNPHKTPRLTWE